ncbi:hypothetical protein [Burkholderia sp. Ax-1719]|uniref:hypothetical protein n=1 Tax=Burkholderia sp. Ax-1719 TaxID=2608334 RepID=UPI00142258FA|nr:hypothetical protein [Burkholderia sp. Ax-1719]NIE65317.1 hypothetical protein [Burkholderia sp. Ax-1719]
MARHERTSAACGALVGVLMVVALGACGGGGGSAGPTGVAGAGTATGASTGAATGTASGASATSGTGGASAASGSAAASNPSTSTPSSGAAATVLKLSTGVQNQTVAKDAAASGMLSSVGVAGLYMAAARPFLTAALAGAPAATANCAKGGTVATVVSNVGAPGLRAGETASVSFAQCVGQITAPELSSADALGGGLNFAVQSVQGVVGSRTANWSYTATETANALAIESSNATTTFSGTVAYTVAYDAATATLTTTASAPSITIGRTQTSASVGTTLDGSIAVTSLAWTDLDNVVSATESLSASCAVSDGVEGVTLAFNVTTPVPLTIANGAITAGTQQLATSDTTETIVAQNATTFLLTVTSQGVTGVWTQSAGSLAS